MYSRMIPSAIGPSSNLMTKEFQEVRDYIFDIKQNDKETKDILRYLNAQNRLFNMELEIEDFYDVELEDGTYSDAPKRPQMMGKAGFLQEMQGFPGILSADLDESLQFDEDLGHNKYMVKPVIGE